MQHSKLDSNPLLNLLYTLTLFVFNFLVLSSLLAFPDLGLVYGRQVAILHLCVVKCILLISMSSLLPVLVCMLSL